MPTLRKEKNRGSANMSKLSQLTGVQHWGSKFSFNQDLCSSFPLSTSPPCCLACCCSVVSDSATPWTAARQASLSSTISRSLLTLVSTESAMPPNQLVLCHPPLLLPSIFPSIRVFSNEDKVGST